MSDLLIRRRNLLMRKQEEELNIRAVCFKADGEQTVAITKVGSAPAITMQYSYDGVTWDAWGLTPLPFGGNTKVYVRGVNNAKFSTNNTSNTFTFGTDSYVYVSGIAEALLNGENEVLQYSTPYTFKLLFKDQIALREADRLRFEAMSNSENCYQAMFSGCSNLLSAPELPATKLGYAPYRSMFNGCTSLIKAPSILPAITIGAWAYASMFYGCTSLVNAPELPATKLSEKCYQSMFGGCTSLKTIRCRAKFKSTDATYLWLDNVSASGTFYGHSKYGYSSGASGIPTTWTFEELTD